MMKGYTRAELVDMCNSMKDQLEEYEDVMKHLIKSLTTISEEFVDLLDIIKND